MIRNQGIILETPRMLMRTFELYDAESIYMLNSDPEVIQYTGDKAFESIEAARQFILNYDVHERYGYGRMALVLKDTFEFIGFCGLRYYDHRNATDIGFRLMKQYWGRGYATEAAKACIEYGFNTLNLDLIEAWTDPENYRSIRVIEKLQMPFIDKIWDEDRLWNKFELTRQDHNAMTHSM